MIEKALKLKIPVITEVELAYQISEAPIVGITGTNGKNDNNHNHPPYVKCAQRK